MPFDQAQTQPESWESFFRALPFIQADNDLGRRNFWAHDAENVLDATEACASGQHLGLSKGVDWADRTVSALRGSHKRGVLLRILRDMEFESAEAVGFIGALEDVLAGEETPL